MNLELEVAEALRADATLMAILLGGVYTEEEVGVEGIRRGDSSPTADAFDQGGILQPCAVVRHHSPFPSDEVRDEDEGMMSVQQVISVFYYQFRGHLIVDSAKDRGYSVLQGFKPENTTRLSFLFETDAIADMGPVANSTVLRQDWQTFYVRRR